MYYTCTYLTVLDVLLSSEFGIHLSCRLSTTSCRVRYPARVSEKPACRGEWGGGGGRGGRGERGRGGGGRGGGGGERGRGGGVEGWEGGGEKQ